MTYASTDFKTKKALREAVARGDEVTVYEPGGGEPPTDGTVYLEGPHYPKPHAWYAAATLRRGKVVKVR